MDVLNLKSLTRPSMIPWKNNIEGTYETYQLLKIQGSRGGHLKGFNFPTFPNNVTRKIYLSCCWPMLKDKTIWIGRNNLSDGELLKNWFPLPISPNNIYFFIRMDIPCIVVGIVERIYIREALFPEVQQIELVKLYFLHFKMQIYENQPLFFLSRLYCKSTFPRLYIL